MTEEKETYREEEQRPEDNEDYEDECTLTVDEDGNEYTECGDCCCCW